MSKTDSTGQRRIVAVAACVAAITAIVHGRALVCGFVNWDDPSNILDNEHINSFSYSNLRWMWTSGHLGVYEPLSWMFKTVIVSTVGTDATWFHVVSLTLHACNAVLFFFIARRLLISGLDQPLIGVAAKPGRQQTPHPSFGGQEGSAGAVLRDATTSADGAITLAAAAAAVMFSTHPLRVECVAWASGQPYLLAALFVLATVLAYLRGWSGSSRAGWWFTLAILTFACALLFKSIAIPLPCILVLLAIYPLRLIGGERGWFTPPAMRVWLCLVPLFALSALTAWKAQSLDVTSIVRPEQIGLIDRCAIAGYGTMFYAAKTLVPTGLAAMYPLPPTPWPSSAFAAPAAVSILITVCVGVLYRRVPMLFVSWIAYLVFLAPVLGWVRHGDQLVALRYSYLSCLGVAILFGAFFLRGSVIAKTVATVFLCVMMVMTWVETGHWRDSKRLWAHALDVDAQNWVAHNNLANYYLDEALPEKALGLARSALAIKEEYGDAHFTMGLALEDLNNDPEAEAAYRRALEIVPFHKAANRLGALLHRTGRRQDSVKVYERGVALHPANETLRANLASVYTDMGRFADAQKLLLPMARTHPQDTRLLLTLARTYIGQQRIDEAMSYCRQVAKLDPENTEVQYHLGFLLQLEGQYAESVESYSLFVAAHPERSDARQELALALLTVVRTADGVAQLEECVRRDPDNIALMHTLARILATCLEDDVRNGVRSLQLANRIIELIGAPNPQILDTKAAALATLGRFEEAIGALNQAIQVVPAGGEQLRSELMTRRDLYAQGRTWRIPAAQFNQKDSE